MEWIRIVIITLIYVHEPRRLNTVAAVEYEIPGYMYADEKRRRNQQHVSRPQSNSDRHPRHLHRMAPFLQQLFNTTPTRMSNFQILMKQHQQMNPHICFIPIRMEDHKKFNIYNKNYDHTRQVVDNLKFNANEKNEIHLPVRGNHEGNSSILDKLSNSESNGLVLSQDMTESSPNNDRNEKYSQPNRHCDGSHQNSSLQDGNLATKHEINMAQNDTKQIRSEISQPVSSDASPKEIRIHNNQTASKNPINSQNQSYVRLILQELMNGGISTDNNDETNRTKTNDERQPKLTLIEAHTCRSVQEPLTPTEGNRELKQLMTVIERNQSTKVKSSRPLHLAEITTVNEQSATLGYKSYSLGSSPNDTAFNLKTLHKFQELTNKNHKLNDTSNEIYNEQENENIGTRKTGPKQELKQSNLTLMARSNLQRLNGSDVAAKGRPMRENLYGRQGASKPNGPIDLVALPKQQPLDQKIKSDKETASQSKVTMDLKIPANEKIKFKGLPDSNIVMKLKIPANEQIKFRGPSNVSMILKMDANEELKFKGAPDSNVTMKLEMPINQEVKFSRLFPNRTMKIKNLPCENSMEGAKPLQRKTTQLSERQEITFTVPSYKPTNMCMMAGGEMKIQVPPKKKNMLDYKKQIEHNCSGSFVEIFDLPTCKPFKNKLETNKSKFQQGTNKSLTQLQEIKDNSEEVDTENISELNTDCFEGKIKPDGLKDQIVHLKLKPNGAGKVKSREDKAKIKGGMETDNRIPEMRSGLQIASSEISRFIGSRTPATGHKRSVGASSQQQVPTNYPYRLNLKTMASNLHNLNYIKENLPENRKFNNNKNGEVGNKMGRHDTRDMTGYRYRAENLGNDQVDENINSSGRHVQPFNSSVNYLVNDFMNYLDELKPSVRIKQIKRKSTSQRWTNQPEEARYHDPPATDYFQNNDNIVFRQNDVKFGRRKKADRRHKVERSNCVSSADQKTLEENAELYTTKQIRLKHRNFMKRYAKSKNWSENTEMKNMKRLKINCLQNKNDIHQSVHQFLQNKRSTREQCSGAFESTDGITKSRWQNQHCRSNTESASAPEQSGRQVRSMNKLNWTNELSSEKFPISANNVDSAGAVKLLRSTNLPKNKSTSSLARYGKSTDEFERPSENNRCTDVPGSTNAMRHRRNTSEPLASVNCNCSARNTTKIRRTSEPSNVKNRASLARSLADFHTKINHSKNKKARSNKILKKHRSKMVDHSEPENSLTDETKLSNIQTNIRNSMGTTEKLETKQTHRALLQHIQQDFMKTEDQNKVQTTPLTDRRRAKRDLQCCFKLDNSECGISPAKFEKIKQINFEIHNTNLNGYPLKETCVEMTLTKEPLVCRNEGWADCWDCSSCDCEQSCGQLQALLAKLGNSSSDMKKSNGHGKDEVQFLQKLGKSPVQFSMSTRDSPSPLSLPLIDYLMQNGLLTSDKINHSIIKETNVKQEKNKTGEISATTLLNKLTQNSEKDQGNNEFMNYLNRQRNLLKNQEVTDKNKKVKDKHFGRTKGTTILPVQPVIEPLSDWYKGMLTGYPWSRLLRTEQSPIDVKISQLIHQYIPDNRTGWGMLGQTEATDKLSSTGSPAPNQTGTKEDVKRSIGEQLKQFQRDRETKATRGPRVNHTAEGSISMNRGEQKINSTVSQAQLEGTEFKTKSFPVKSRTRPNMKLNLRRSGKWKRPAVQISRESIDRKTYFTDNRNNNDQEQAENLNNSNNCNHKKIKRSLSYCDPQPNIKTENGLNARQHGKSSMNKNSLLNGKVKNMKKYVRAQLCPVSSGKTVMPTIKQKHCCNKTKITTNNKLSVQQYPMNHKNKCKESAALTEKSRHDCVNETRIKESRKAADSCTVCVPLDQQLEITEDSEVQGTLVKHSKQVHKPSSKHLGPANCRQSRVLEPRTQRTDHGAVRGSQHLVVESNQNEAISDDEWEMKVLELDPGQIPSSKDHQTSLTEKKKRIITKNQLGTDKNTNDTHPLEITTSKSLHQGKMLWEEQQLHDVKYRGRHQPPSTRQDDNKSKLARHLQSPASTGKMTAYQHDSGLDESVSTQNPDSIDTTVASYNNMELVLVLEKESRITTEMGPQQKSEISSDDSRVTTVKERRNFNFDIQAAPISKQYKSTLDTSKNEKLRKENFPDRQNIKTKDSEDDILEEVVLNDLYFDSGTEVDFDKDHLERDDESESKCGTKQTDNFTADNESIKTRGNGPSQGQGGSEPGITDACVLSSQLWCQGKASKDKTHHTTTTEPEDKEHHSNSWSYSTNKFTELADKGGKFIKLIILNSNDTDDGKVVTMNYEDDRAHRKDIQVPAERLQDQSQQKVLIDKLEILDAKIMKPKKLSGAWNSIDSEISHGKKIVKFRDDKSKNINKVNQILLKTLKEILSGNNEKLVKCNRTVDRCGEDNFTQHRVTAQTSGFSLKQLLPGDSSSARDWTDVSNEAEVKVSQTKKMAAGKNILYRTIAPWQHRETPPSHWGLNLIPNSAGRQKACLEVYEITSSKPMKSDNRLSRFDSSDVIERVDKDNGTDKRYRDLDDYKTLVEEINQQLKKCLEAVIFQQRTAQSSCHDPLRRKDIISRQSLKEKRRREGNQINRILNRIRSRYDMQSQGPAFPNKLQLVNSAKSVGNKTKRLRKHKHSSRGQNQRKLMVNNYRVNNDYDVKDQEWQSQETESNTISRTRARNSVSRNINGKVIGKNQRRENNLIANALKCNSIDDLSSNEMQETQSCNAAEVILQDLQRPGQSLNGRVGVAVSGHLDQEQGGHDGNELGQVGIERAALPLAATERNQVQHSQTRQWDTGVVQAVNSTEDQDKRKTNNSVIDPATQKQRQGRIDMEGIHESLEPTRKLDNACEQEKTNYDSNGKGCGQHEISDSQNYEQLVKQLLKSELEQRDDIKNRKSEKAMRPQKHDEINRRGFQNEDINNDWKTGGIPSTKEINRLRKNETDTNEENTLLLNQLLSQFVNDHIVEAMTWKRQQKEKTGELQTAEANADETSIQSIQRKGGPTSLHRVGYDSNKLQQSAKGFKNWKHLCTNNCNKTSLKAMQDNRNETIDPPSDMITSKNRHDMLILPMKFTANEFLRLLGYSEGGLDNGTHNLNAECGTDQTITEQGLPDIQFSVLTTAQDETTRTGSQCLRSGDNEHNTGSYNRRIAGERSTNFRNKFYIVFDSLDPCRIKIKNVTFLPIMEQNTDAVCDPAVKIQISNYQSDLKHSNDQLLSSRLVTDEDSETKMQKPESEQIQLQNNLQQSGNQGKARKIKGKLHGLEKLTFQLRKPLIFNRTHQVSHVSISISELIPASPKRPTAHLRKHYIVQVDPQFEQNMWPGRHVDFPGQISKVIRKAIIRGLALGIPHLVPG